MSLAPGMKALMKRGEGSMFFLNVRANPGTVFGIVGGVILLGIFSMAGCSRGEKPASSPSLPPLAVRIVSPEASGITREISVAGVVRGIHEADLTARVEGQVERIPVHLGEKVAKGQLLVVLSGQTYAAHLSRAQAALAYARTNFARIDRLFHDGSASRSEWDRAKQALDVAVAEEKGASAQLSWTRVLAPFAGRVAHRAVHRGDVVHIGRPLLSVIDSSRLEVVAHIPDANVGYLKIGLPVRFDVDGKEMSGRIRDLSPRSDPLTHTVTVKVLLAASSQKSTARGIGRIPGVDHLVGVYGKLYIPVAGSPGIFVPASAVIDHEGLHELFVVRNDHAELRYVRTGRSENGKTEILSGISAKEKIVASPPPTLEDGRPVVRQVP